MKVEQITELGPFELENGALLSRTTDDCEVCVSKGQENEPATFVIEFEGQTVHICKAHAQQLLDENETRRQDKNSIFYEVFHIKDPSQSAGDKA